MCRDDTELIFWRSGRVVPAACEKEERICVLFWLRGHDSSMTRSFERLIMITRFGLMAFQGIGDAKWARPRTSQVSIDFGVDRWPVIESSIA